MMVISEINSLMMLIGICFVEKYSDRRRAVIIKMAFSYRPDKCAQKASCYEQACYD